MTQPRLGALVAVAVLSAAGVAQAQVPELPLGISGTLDAAADTTNKTAGQGALGRVGSPVGRISRVSPSMTAISKLKFESKEELGGGYKAGFVLEMQPTNDNGTLGNDGRGFGRQAFVSLTTPFGEVRAGRQYAPMFYAKALSTTEQLAGTDLFTALLTVNNLTVRQDNQLSYWIRQGFDNDRHKILASLAISPNAGVPKAGINASRAPATSAATPQILGGSSAGEEGRGRAIGGFINYVTGGLSVSVAGHHNRFGVPLYFGTTTALPIGILDDYRSFGLAARYVMDNGLAFAASFGEGRYRFSAANPFLPSLRSDGMKIRTMVFGVKYTIDSRWAIGAMAGRQEFRNFTKGKDDAIVLGADYSLSKRTALYARYGHLKDKQGTSIGPALISGGPEPFLTATGLRETPAWNGIGVNAGGKSDVLAIGIRHSF